MKIFFLLLLASAHAQASGYPGARLNQNICEEISGQGDRKIPKTDWFCGAVDGQAYARTVGSSDFYHGVGHWTQGRTEFFWEDTVWINFRSVLYSGSSSQGYAQPTGNYHLGTFRFSYPERILGAKTMIRIGDLDRQTIGEGLLVEARESNGGVMVLDWDKVQFRFLQESTGFLVSDDDVSNPELSFWNRRVGLGSAWFYKQTRFQEIRRTYFYTFVNIPVESWAFVSEIGARNNQVSYLGKIAHEWLAGNFSMKSVLQGRYYSNGFAQGFAGQTQLQYVSYDQYNKDYTNSINIFAKDDHVIVGSLILNMQYEWTHAHRAAFQNEIGKYDYKDKTIDEFYFGRLEYDFYPFPLREDHFAIFVTNKLMNETYYIPPTYTSMTTVAQFRSRIYGGIEGNFRF